VTKEKFIPEQVLSFWFPEDLSPDDPDAMAAFWDSRMHGGMDAAICSDFADLTYAAARGELDHWAETAEGRLALILALDQFPRSLWRGTPGAYGQDIKSTRLALEGLENGHYQALDGYVRKAFYTIAIGHCEGPDHLERMDRLVGLWQSEIAAAPEYLKAELAGGLEQNQIVREVIRSFGRHPHRNAILGRISTAAEQVYIDKGEFPHERRPVPPKPE
jgi:uncharacterized protein (DUF924 family)